MPVHPATDTKPDTDPANHSAPPAHSFRLAEVLRIVAMAGIGGGAIGYLLATYHDGTLDVLARIFGIVAMVAVVIMLFEAPRRRRIERVDQGLQQIGQRLDERPEAPRCESCFAEGYVRGLQRRPPDDEDRRHLHSV